MGSDSRDAMRMEKNDLIDEVIRLRAIVRDGTRGRDVARANERICRLEARITETAVELLKTRSRLKAAHDQIRKQQVAIEDAQANAAKFHAQLLFERVTKLPQRKAS